MTMPLSATIYHNPTCGTSRNTLALLRHAGIEPVIVEYLKTPLDRTRLLRLIDDARLSPRAALREKESAFAALGLDGNEISDDDIIDAMLKHPILINRPFVVTELGTRLCRPSEVLLEIIPPLPSPFIKEDGGVIGV